MTTSNRTVGHGWLVDDLASVRTSVRLGNREPESGAVASATRLRAASEPVEEARDELRRNAAAPILDSETKVPVLPVRGDRDRWLAVPQRIRDEVREHAIERRWIHNGVEVRWNGDLHCVRLGIRERTNQLLDLRTETNGHRRDMDRLQVEAGEVK